MPYSRLHAPLYRQPVHDADDGLIGRDRELGRLADAIGAAVAGSPGFLLVLGEAGIGKTRLLRAAARLADRAGWRVLWGTAIESGRSIPYLPLLAPLTALVEGSGRGGQASRVPSDDAMRVIRGALAGPARTADEGSSRRSLDTARLMEAVFDVLGRQPTLLVVDDAQWADASTLTVLDYVAHRARHEPLVVLAAARDEEPATLSRLPIADGRRFQAMALSRLSPTQVRLQAAALLGTTVSGSRAAALHRRTAGNPMFVEQVIAQADRDRGAPASLRALVMRRVTGLENEVRRVLDALAIIGRPAEPALIARVAGMSIAAADDALAAAIRAGVVVTDEAGVALRHPLFGEVIDAELSGPARRGLHAAAAEAESEAHGDAAEIANHWWFSGDSARAWSSASAAAVAATRSFAFAEVRLHLQRATEVWPEGEPGKLDALVELARAAWLSGDPAGALRLARAAQELEPGRAESMIEVGVYAWDAGYRGEATEAFIEAGSLIGADADPVLRGRASWGLGRAFAVTRSEEAAELGLRAAALAREAGDLVLRSEGLALAAMARAFSGALDGLRWLDEAVDLALQSGESPHVAGHAFQFKVDLLGLAGAREEALATALAGIEACARLGLARTHGSDLRGRAALLLLESGRMADALDVVEPADERAFAALALGVLEMRRGDPDAAAAALDAASTSGAIGGPGALGGWLELARVELAWLGGDGPGARRWLDAIVPPPGVWGADVGAWTARWRARIDPAIPAGLRAAAGGHPDPAVRGALVMEVRAATGDASGTDRPAAWAQAADAWLAAGRPWESAWARLSEGEAHFADRHSAPGKAALEAALAVASEIGAEPVRQAADRLARRARIRVGPPARSRLEADEPTAREREVLTLLAEGLTNVQIAGQLFLSPKTVGIHVSHLLAKLGAHTRGEAVAIARRRGQLE